MNNNVYYTFLAGWCAESAGARLEFQKKRFTKYEVNDAMHMTGPTTSGIYPGQITDDSEMEISLLSALVEGKNDEYFPLDRIAEKYIEWYNSKPFDIGQTTTYALLDATNASDMLTNAYEYNIDSESNGSLMRCIPLAIFGIKKDVETIINISFLESELTHSNKIVGEITGIYCVIISYILRKKINQTPINIDTILLLVTQLIKTEKLLEWFVIGNKLTNLEDYNSLQNEGHVKHAFIFVIYFLRNIEKYTYENAISEVIQCGGDTDTNAKIVGNLFGAYYGDCVPSYMSDIVLNFDCTTIEDRFFRRPEKYSIKYALLLMNNII
jgi:ADP-ribosyl-[dinitrogen reductase] hydrolase